MKRSLYKGLNWFVSLSIIFFLLWRIYLEWEQLDGEVSLDIDWSYLILSESVLLLLAFYQTFIWQQMVSTWSSELSLSKAFRIFTLSNLGRYIPGKIWHLLGVAYMSEKENLCGIRASMTAMMGFILSVISGCLFAFILLAQNPLAGDKLNLWYGVGAVFFLLLLINPYAIDKISALISKYSGRSFESLDFGYGLLIKFFLHYLLFWILYGIAFIAFVKSFYPIDIVANYSIAAIYPLSFILGYLAFFAPGGLGVREGVITYLLAFYMPFPVAGIVAVSSRIWLTSVELISVAIALKIK